MNKDVMTGRMTDRSSARPTWWWLLAAFLAFAVIVTGAFVWQRATRMTAQRIYDELSALDPSVTAEQLKDNGYVYGGRAEHGWRAYSADTGEDSSYPWYVLGGSEDERIAKFVADVRSGRESILRLYVEGVAPYRSMQSGADAGNGDSAGVSVRVLWFDPNVDATWAEKPSGSRPVVIHHDGKGQIREWWWRSGDVVIADKRFARSIAREDSYGETYVLKHRPPVPADAGGSDRGGKDAGVASDRRSNEVIIPYDEVFYSSGA
ncbi:hypothetical protein BW13_08690 [Bifidobacterium sp. UTCIF-37]|uniref:hypothetical protein n=1 Tax=unclassified Bifidobacterium TaxID=2608897 RepID=UPI001129E7AF|nr:MULTISPECIES: hypothetical protein [unclassified Bifidobacterium]TPF85789.1 hypothetical protein BW13_08690 [Bifidobacterium sp. UTCIF-37]TPF87766.1 hypothetical protein BW11_09635 [Bifidobacterium sp. UTCIF-38]